MYPNKYVYSTIYSEFKSRETELLYITEIKYHRILTITFSKSTHNYSYNITIYNITLIFDMLYYV